MKAWTNPTNLIAAAVALAALCFAGARIGVGAPEESEPAKIAFIDVSKVLNAHKGLKKMEQEVDQFLKSAETEITQAEEELKKLESELIVYAEESLEYVQGKNEVELKDLSLKQRKRSLILERDSRVTKGLKDAYREIERAAGEYAAMQGIQAVFPYTQGIDKVNTKRPEDILKWVSMVDVVWHEDRLDISDAVITIINGS